MRTRELKREENLPWSSVYTQYDPSPPPGVNGVRQSGTLLSPVSVSSITDTQSPKLNKRQRRLVKRREISYTQPMNYCAHDKRLSYYGTQAVQYGRNTPGNTWYMYFTSPYALLKYAWTNSIDDAVCNPIPIDLSPYAESMWEELYPAMPQEIDLAVFLSELGDLQDMFAIFTKKYYRTQNSAIDIANSQYIQSQLAWKPFVQDLGNLLTTALDFEYNLNRYLDGEGKVHKARARREVSLSSYNVSEERIDSEMWRKRVISYNSSTGGKCYLNFNVEYSYTVPGRDRWDTRLKAWLDTLGLCQGWTFLWEKIPLSFVFDWFVDISSFIRKPKRRNELPADAIVHQATISYKQKWSKEVHVGSRFGAPYSNTGDHLLFHDEGSVYKRIPYMPSGQVSLNTPLRPRLMLGSALLLGIFRRRV